MLTSPSGGAEEASGFAGDFSGKDAKGFGAAAFALFEPSAANTGAGTMAHSMQSTSSIGTILFFIAISFFTNFLFGAGLSLSARLRLFPAAEMPEFGEQTRKH